MLEDIHWYAIVSLLSCGELTPEVYPSILDTLCKYLTTLVLRFTRSFVYLVTSVLALQNTAQYPLRRVTLGKYFLTYSMVQSPYSEANWFATSQEILRISRNPKVHYRTHKRPPPVSILGQPNPVHIPTSHLLEIRSNIIHPSTPRSPQWSPSFRFLHQDPIHPLSSPIRAACPAHLILLDVITRTI